MTSIKGKIQTVLGAISPEQAGVVMAHEHLSANAEALMTSEPPRYAPELCNQPLSVEIMWWLLQHPYSSFDNAHLYEERDAVLQEMRFYKKNGGGTIVDNTTFGIRRDVDLLVQVASETKVHVVAGTGYYVGPSRPETANMSIEEMAEVMSQEITVGCDGTDVKAGVIGEIGCCWPLAESEKRCIQASAQVEAQLGCPVIVHPGRHEDAPREIVRVYQEAGGHVDRLVMSHMDRTIQDVNKLLQFAEMGCYIDYDLFGLETSHYQQAPDTDMPSDAQRISHIRNLVDGGFGERITIGHDIHTKHRLMKYGGHGYSHILLNVAPKMLARGISKEAVDKILRQNPQRWLTFA